ncbi:MAG: response regulator [Verrucomicrobia bacterium]|nr:response regulator [Verrucomicrobiota bacterium]
MAAPTAQQPAPATILVVDDDRGLLRLLERTLRREGYQVFTAESGAQTLEWFAAHHADLMLLDLKLQDIEGGEIVSQLDVTGRKTPFIIITGQGDERVAVEMMKRGALDYLVKDVRFQEFVPTVVRRALEQLEQRRKLAAAEEEGRRLQQEILTIVEREQSRISRDLHDSLGQQLAGIELMSQVLEQQLAKKSKPTAKHAGEIARLVRQAISHTRDLAQGLSPVMHEPEGLMSALHALASGTEQLSRIPCEFRCPSPVLVPDNMTATHLYRIAQEAVSNALKHAQATRLRISLCTTPTSLVLAVEDDGVGFRQTAGGRKGMGMRIMSYRAGMIGGTFVVQKRAGNGTTVVCTVHNPPASTSTQRTS